MIITIDGVSASGKSSYAKIIGEKFGLESISSGNLYRYITKQIINNHCSDFEVSLENILSNIHLTIDTLKNLNDPELYSELVEKHVSWVASHPTVRELINAFLRNICMNNNVVLDGRDMASVFPEADLKLYFYASYSERLQIIKIQNQEEYKSLERKLKQRDTNDSFIKKPKETIQINPFHYTEDVIIDMIRKKA